MTVIPENLVAVVSSDNVLRRYQIFQDEGKRYVRIGTEYELLDTLSAFIEEAAIPQTSFRVRLDNI